jgi:hypothetical protein
MMQTSLLHFESSTFAITPGEDERTNPGIFGQALANWVAGQLRTRGLQVGGVIAEDFGWCVPVRIKPYSVYVACASESEESNQWQLFAFAEGGLLNRLLGKDNRAEALNSVFGAVKQALESSSDIRNIEEETR